MKIKELKEKIELAEKEGKINDETEVVINGECYFGITTLDCTVDKMVHIDGIDVISEPKNVFKINVDADLRENEDIGCCDVWLCEEDFEVFKKDCTGEV